VKQVKDAFFTRVEGTNAWVESNQKGELLFDRGEVEIAKRFAEAFPNWEIRVTIGPYRGYDIEAHYHKEEKVVDVDLYSPGLALRPGVVFGYVPELIEAGKKKMEQQGLKP